MSPLIVSSTKLLLNPKFSSFTLSNSLVLLSSISSSVRLFNDCCDWVLSVPYLTKPPTNSFTSSSFKVWPVNLEIQLLMACNICLHQDGFGLSTNVSAHLAASSERILNLPSSVFGLKP